jgi:hypothetical protein
MEGKPTREFGKRVPAAIQPTVPVKRSHHVALLLMGTFAVGGGAYALTPRESCQPPPPGAAAPAASQAGACAPRGFSSGAGRGGWGNYYARNNFFSSDSSSGRASAAVSSDSGSGAVTRGGFGSFARAFTMHFSGGG